MNFYKKITNIQIETSTICNAACPQCLREWRGDDYSWFNQTYIPTEFYETRIPDKVYQDLESINFCGTMGDPCAAPNFIDVCSVIKRKNPNIKISIATNGGMKSPDWWAKLAKVLSPSDSIIFGIDGLEDTNWIYRKNVKWDKLIDNVKSFIRHGGIALWQFIVFKHNEHQIPLAKEYSKKLGFSNFFTIYNNRFFVEELFGRPAKGADGNLLEPPDTKEEQSLLLRTVPVLSEEEWLKVAEVGNIKCQAQSLNEAYIDAETHLVPCCYIAGAKFTLNADDPDGYHKLWTQHGGDKIKLSLHDWDDVLASNFFIELQHSWDKKFKDGRLLVCSGTCSTNTESKFTVYKNKKNEI
jgi:sulfatase maturation enzyme AslB (radical SAM superfamily)